jgi:hypothetical protein
MCAKIKSVVTEKTMCFCYKDELLKFPFRIICVYLENVLN